MNPSFSVYNSLYFALVDLLLSRRDERNETPKQNPTDERNNPYFGIKMQNRKAKTANCCLAAANVHVVSNLIPTHKTAAYHHIIQYSAKQIEKVSAKLKEMKTKKQK